jgi:hypothetical protein
VGNNGKKICEEPEKQKEEGGFRNMLSELAEAENQGIISAALAKGIVDLTKENMWQSERVGIKLAGDMITALKKHIDERMPEKYYEVELQKVLLQHSLERDRLDFEKDRESYRMAEKLTQDPINTVQFLAQHEERMYRHYLDIETGVLRIKFRTTKLIADLKAQVRMLEDQKRIDEMQIRNADILFSQGKCLLNNGSESEIQKLAKLITGCVETSGRKNQKRKKR